MNTPSPLKINKDYKSWNFGWTMKVPQDYLTSQFYLNPSLPQKEHKENLVLLLTYEGTVVTFLGNDHLTWRRGGVMFFF
jgi:hypothetical protein